MASGALRSLAMSAWFLATAMLWAQPVSAAVATLPQNMPNQQLLISAPTPSLTAIVNNMMMRSKSLTVAVGVAPNLPVSRPVDVTVSYESSLPAKPPERSITSPQRYNAKGLAFIWGDSERDRQPRRVKVNVLFAEQDENGNVTKFAYGYDVVLEPLYDVEIGPLTYHLLENCDGGLLGRNSETKISVGRPDGRRRLHSCAAGCDRAQGLEKKRLSLFPRNQAKPSISSDVFEIFRVQGDDGGANRSGCERDQYIERKFLYFALLESLAAAMRATMSPASCQI